MSNLGKEKSKAEQLQEELFLKPKHAMRGGLADVEIERADQFCEDYKVFLNSAKTEREAAGFFCRKAEALGFTPFNPQKKYHAGDKVYRLNREKAIILAVIGEKSVGEGVRIAAAHIDSPRLDLKPNPLYEDFEMALFKTHYYGGIKKYQWTAIPLSLHGVIIRRDGSKINVSIGEQPDEPKFVVTDLLPHLAQEQMKISIHAPARGATANTANRLPVFTPLLQHILQDFTSIRHIQNAETAKKSKNQVRNSWQFHVRSRFAPVLK